MWKCKNCGKRNPWHTCYTGGQRGQLFIDDRTHRLVAKQMELNYARGKKNLFEGIPGLTREMKEHYMKHDPTRR